MVVFIQPAIHPSAVDGGWNGSGPLSGRTTSAGTALCRSLGPPVGTVAATGIMSDSGFPYRGPARADSIRLAVSSAASRLDSIRFDPGLGCSRFGLIGHWLVMMLAPFDSIRFDSKIQTVIPATVQTVVRGRPSRRSSRRQSRQSSWRPSRLSFRQQSRRPSWRQYRQSSRRPFRRSWRLPSI